MNNRILWGSVFIVSCILSTIKAYGSFSLHHLYLIPLGALNWACVLDLFFGHEDPFNHVGKFLIGVIPCGAFVILTSSFNSDTQFNDWGYQIILAIFLLTCEVIYYFKRVRLIKSKKAKNLLDKI